MDQTPTDGLRQLPVQSILDDLADEFPGMDPAPSPQGPRPVFWQNDDGRTVVELNWSDVHVLAELRPAGLWSQDVANGVIDVLLRHNCPLYDPQTNERFDVSGSN